MTVSAVNIRDITHDVFHGAYQTERNRREVQVFKSNAVAYTETDTAITLFNLPANTLIVAAYVHVTTAFDASGTSAAATATLVVQDAAQTIWDANLVGLQSTGSKLSTDIGIKVGSTGGSLQLLTTLGTTTAGQLEVYVEVVQPETLL